ncbi:MAG: acetate--CoA ligase [Holosporales bacterium]|nr:acetate--CoA ligase [Holosporales bacterium]
MTKNNFNPLKNPASYQKEYNESLENNNAFWLKQTSILDWIQPPTIANGSDFSKSTDVKWFEDGKLNACYNCVDRHAQKTPHKTAIIFEADQPGKTIHITYRELYEKVCQFSGVLKALGVKKGDVVTLYLPTIPETIYAMLACTRLGAIHSVVFAGFSATALASRIVQAKPRLIITTETNSRGGKTFSLKKNVYEALKENLLNKNNTVEKVLLVGQSLENKNTDSVSINIKEFNFESLSKLTQPVYDYAEMCATDPLFILHTSGSAGIPRGIVHSTGGYLVYVALTHKFVFDLQENDVYFCTADIGWITGHSYGVYGPFANGATTVLFQGTPTYPDASRFWKIIDENKVTIFYTAPTALRSLRSLGDDFVNHASLESLRILASVGEAIDPSTWQWFFEKIGKSHCPIMDTWWQTESGGVLICPLLKQPQKPGCAAKPFFGIEPRILHEVGGNPEEKEALWIKQSWPGLAMGVWGDQQCFKQSYSSENFYNSGDGAKIDEDGDIWVLGRIDDVLNVSGHRMSSAELERAVISHPAVSEACVVGYPHDIKGQGIFVFAIPRNNVSIQSEHLCEGIKQNIRKEIGPIATPDVILLVSDLPKTRSGKIVRRILRKIVSKDFENLGDTTTLGNPSCIETIIMQVLNKNK